MFYESSYLIHFGIPGMKWGERRFQNEDGTLTEAGKERYRVNIEDAKKKVQDAKIIYKENKKRKYGESDISYKNRINKNKARYLYAKDKLADERAKQFLNNEKTKSKHRIKLEEKFRNDGMSPEEAEIAAYKREKAEKTVAIGAAASIAVIGSIIAYRHYDLNTDRIVKAGTVVQSLGNEAGRTPDRAFYGAYLDRDKKIYDGFMGKHFKGEGMPGFMKPKYNGTWKMEANAAGDIRIAGKKAGKQAFEELLKNDEDFARIYKNTGYDVYNKIGSFKGNDKYTVFNRRLPIHDLDNQKLIDKYYDALRRKGYDAVIDLNDKSSEGFGAYGVKSPAIFFNSKKFNNVREYKIDEKILEQNYKNVAPLAYGRAIIAALRPKIALYGGGALAIKKFSDEEAKKYVIRKYRTEHPKTNLNDHQILDVLYKN